MLNATEVIAAIKERFPLVDYAWPYLQNPRRRGHEVIARCCFHKEKTPSLVLHDHGDPVRPDTFHCFGCEASGDLIDFVMGAEHIRKGAAIRRLAEQAGIDPDNARPLRRAEREHGEDLKGQCDLFFLRMREAMVAGLERAMERMGDERPLCAFESYNGKGELVPVIHGVWNTPAIDDAEFYGEQIRLIDSLTPAERLKIFLAIRTDADVTVWRERSKAESQMRRWLADYVSPR